MYRPSREQQFLLGLPWQPVPVHTRPNDEDGLLAPGNGNCPNADRAYQLLLQTDEAKKEIAKYSALYRNLTEWSGMNVTDWETAGNIYDTVMIERLYGLNVPQWAIDFFDELEKQQDLSFVWYAKPPLLQRLRAGSLAKEILGNMKEAIKQENSQRNQDQTDVRLHMYSTHDTLVASLLELLEVFDGKAPKYCATVLVELWQDIGSGNYTVKVNYLNYFSMIIKELLSIPLPEFETKYARKMPDDWSSECGRNVPKFPAFRNRGL